MHCIVEPAPDSIVAANQETFWGGLLDLWSTNLRRVPAVIAGFVMSHDVLGPFEVRFVVALGLTAVSCVYWSHDLDDVLDDSVVIKAIKHVPTDKEYLLMHPKVIQSKKRSVK